MNYHAFSVWHCCVDLEFAPCIFRNARVLFLVHALPFPGSSRAIRFVKSFWFLIYSFCLHRHLFWTLLPWQVKMDDSSSSLFVSKNLSLSLQSNYFCWHPSPLTSFQMHLMSLSLSMRAFECLLLQDFCCCCCYFCLSSGATSWQTSEISHPPNPSTLVFPAFGNHGSINGSFQDSFCHFWYFLVYGNISTTKECLWEIGISILSEIVADSGPWHWCLWLPAPKASSLCVP